MMAAKGAEAEVFTDLMDVVGMSAEQAYDRIKAEDQMEFVTGQEAFRADLAAEAGQKPYYQAEEIGDDLGIPVEETFINAHGEQETIVRERIPSYEVYPELFKSRATKAANARASEIMDVKLREQLLAKEIIDIDDTYAKLKVAGNKAATAERIKLQQANLENNVTLGQYDVALKINEMANFSDAQKKLNRDNIHQTKEVDTYEQVLAEDNVEAMQQILDNTLVKEQDEYVEKGGKLDANNRENYARRFRSRIEAFKKSQEDGLKDQTILDNFNAQTLRDQLLDGNSVPVPVINGILANPLVSTKNKVMVQEAAIAQPVIQSVYSVRSADLATIDVRRGKTKFTDMRIAKAVDAHIQARDEMMAKSPLLVAKKSANKNFQLNKLDFNKFGESIMERVPIVNEITAHYRAFKGFMYPEEAQDMVSFIHSQPLDRQWGLIVELSKIPSEVQTQVYEQLKMTKDAPLFSMAGRMMAEGKAQLASDIMYGMQHADKMKIRPKDSELNFYIEQSMPLAFKNNATEYNAKNEATKAIYLATMSRLGKRDEVVDAEVVQTIVDKLNGGPIFTVGSSNIAPPIDGMTGRDFRSWLGNLDPEYLNSFNGGPEGFTNKQVLKMVGNGELQLVQLSRTQFAIQSPQAEYGEGYSTYVTNKQGSTFVFEYDPAAAVIKKPAPPEPTIAEKTRLYPQTQYGF